MVTINWTGDLRFEAKPPTGHTLVLDGAAPGDGPSPMEALLASLGACAAMDVISILEKKRQKVDSYRIEVSGTRQPEGTWPRPYETISVRHVVVGENLDPVAVARAVELSDEKYCSVLATLRGTPTVESTWSVERLPEQSEA